MGLGDPGKRVFGAGPLLHGDHAEPLALGAAEIHWDKRPPDADYVILADPEGNRFCVVDIS